MYTDDSARHDRASLIFLIGDDSGNEISDLLANIGYQIVAVADCRSGLERIRHGKEPELLIVFDDVKEYEKLQGLRSRSEYYLPVIAITDRQEDDAVLSYRQCHVDTVLRRPVNRHLLQMNVSLALRLRQNEAYHELQFAAYRRQLCLEQEVAATIYNNVLQNHFLNTEVVKAAMPSMSLFSGDLLLVERTPDNHLHVLLGDFSCHGLAASVVAAPAASIFYGMTRKGFSIIEIVREINAKLHKMLPINQFLAATAVALYPETKKMGLVPCGLPNQILLNDVDGSYEIINHKNVALGVYRSIDLNEQHFSVNEHYRLFLMSEGAVSAENHDGEPFGIERVLDAIARQPKSAFGMLKQRLAEHTGVLEQKENDISFIELVCDVDNVPWQGGETEAVGGGMQALSWKTSMEFGMDALRELNPVPVMVNALMEIQGLQEHRQSVFLIVSELFANALDHGVLGLDSAIKHTPEGFMRFYELKEERMQVSREGKIRLLFAHRPTERGGQLTIKVSDSGNGFDWQSKPQELSGNTGLSGRGIKLLETLCSRLTYHGKGNRVTAIFDWQK
ncbi:MAG: ATP-binding SpoIIE family protein phosphatase [Gammaproteobacteria bacterium]